MTKISRRNLLKIAGAGSVAAAFGRAGTKATGIGPLVGAAQARRGPDESAPWFEASNPGTPGAHVLGELTSRELTQVVPAADRIELNPLLGAVIETNPQAVAELPHRLDGERARRARTRTTARHPDPGQGQHRHRRRDGDDGRLAGAGRDTCLWPMLR